MEIVLRGLVYFIISLIIMIIFVFIVRKMEEREKKQQEQGATVSGIVLMPKQVESDIEKELKIDKKSAALKSVRGFRERAMSFSPIELINGVEVTVIKNTLNETIDRVTNRQYTQELSCLKIEFYLDEIYHCETIYSEFSFPYNGYYINGYEKYSLEELQGYDWIISEMFSIVEEKKKQIHKEKLKDIEVKYSILSHDLVKNN